MVGPAHKAMPHVGDRRSVAQAARRRTAAALTRWRRGRGDMVGS
jgi:hypothetical protein